MSEEKQEKNENQVEEEKPENVEENVDVQPDAENEEVVDNKTLPVIEEEEPEPEEVVYDLKDVPQESEYSEEEIAAWEVRYAETMKEFKSNELVVGKIVAINDSDVAVDIGFKSEGNIPVEEFSDVASLTVGDDIEVFIDNIEDKEGALALSKKKAEFTRTWEKINDLYQTGEMVEAQIVRRIKGGMVVDLFGIEAFLPGSQIDVHPVRDFDALVNATMDFRIIKVNNARKNVVLSHKVLVEESLHEIREKVLGELEEGQVVEGIVKNITDFGVFVDLGGVDGLLHITDLSWGRVSHPSDVVNLDEKIKVKVLRFDKEKMRISLGLKQLHEHHWDDIEKNYPVNDKFKGKIVSIVKYGAFVELEEGVEGLVHISEMSWTQHIRHPSQMVNIEDEVEVVILNIDRENRKISLGMKQIEEDPWLRLEQVFQPGTKHNGVVRDLVPFGAFIELEPGIDGLIHISDLSWVRKVRHPGEVVKKGQEIEVVILNFDRNERRIALGLKQLEADPWDSFEREYPIRARTEGSVIRVLEKGVVVMLPMGVEGFVPNSQLGRSISGDNKKNIKEGDNLELEVIEFDKTNHRIVLSHSIIERQKDKSTYRGFKDSSDESKTTLGDLVHGAGAEEVLAQTDVKEKAKESAPKAVEKDKPEAVETADETAGETSSKADIEKVTAESKAEEEENKTQADQDKESPESVPAEDTQVPEKEEPEKNGETKSESDQDAKTPEDESEKPAEEKAAAKKTVKKTANKTAETKDAKDESDKPAKPKKATASKTMKTNAKKAEEKNEAGEDDSKVKKTTKKASNEKASDSEESAPEDKKAETEK